MGLEKKAPLFLLGALLLIGAMWILFFRETSPRILKTLDQFVRSEQTREWKKYMDSVGPARAHQAFKDGYAGRPYELQHTMAHLIGDLLFQRLGAEGVIECDSSFGFGCFHQVSIQAILEQGTSAVKKLQERCISRFGEDRAGFCQHGVGHGVLEYYGDYEKNLIPALEVCGKESLSANAVRYCNAGVFMEYQHLLFGGNELPVRKVAETEPFALCNSLSSRFAEDCYKSLGPWFVSYYQGDIQKAFSLCSRSERASSKEACYVGIGMYIPPRNNFDIQASLAACMKLVGASREPCLVGASRGFVIYKGNFQAADILCAGLGEELRSACSYKKM